MFTNGTRLQMTPNVIVTTCVCKFGFKSYEESWTYNCQEVFIYNTFFLDPNCLIAPIGFALASFIF